MSGAQAKRAGKKVVFANGIFDLLHPGHVALLKFAKSHGDWLVVGINSDRSTKELKGPSRPIQTESERQAQLEALDFVDEVVVFDDLRPTEVIRQLMPAVVVKGAEWPAEEVRQRDEIPAEVELVMATIVTDEGGTKLSTTAAIEKLRERVS